MAHAYQKLLEKINLVHDLEKAEAVLAWDRETHMPIQGAGARIDQMTTLSQLRHRLYTSHDMGDLIAGAADEMADRPYDSDESSLIRFLQRDYADQKKISTDFVKRASQISGRAREAWVVARAESDFSHFRPWLEQVVDLCREMSDLYGYEAQAYDPLLERYETDMHTAEVETLFKALKADLIPICQAVAQNADAVDDRLVHQRFDLDKQRRFVRYITAAVGYDYDRGHLGTVIHPFCTNFSRDDVRITTRWGTDFLNPALFGALHEAGHGLYEQGTDPKHYRTPLASGTSLGIHESQSRLIENMVGRSKGFWRKHFNQLRSVLADQFRHVTSDDFYKAINKVQPSLIRVEADEVYYNLHIILRFELELAMLNGDLTVRDLPAAWHEKMAHLIGITPPDNARGCLQDVHWTRPGFGYFPTYALGNLYAAQFLEAAVSRRPAIAADLAEGETESLLSWLRDNIHQHGRKYTPTELVQKAPASRWAMAPLFAICKANTKRSMAFRPNVWSNDIVI